MERPRESKLGQNMYEQVLTRNFEVIERFLSEFHSIYQKQDEFQVGLGKLEHKISLVEKNTKRFEETLGKYNDLSEKKMNSLKEFVLEKLKVISEKAMIGNVEEEKNKVVEERKVKEIEEIPQILYKYDESLNEQIKKMEWQISSINQRISSITVLTNSIDEKVGNSTRINKTVSENQFVEIMKQFECKVNEEIEGIGKKVERMENIWLKQYEKISKTFENKISEYELKYVEMVLKLDEKVSNNKFEDFKNDYKDEQSSMIQEISQTFSNKRETSKCINLLEKKLVKLEMIEEILKENDENSQARNTVNTSMYQFKPKSPSIHTHKRFAKSIGQPNNSMLIRKVNAKSKIFEDRM